MQVTAWRDPRGRWREGFVRSWDYLYVEELSSLFRLQHDRNCHCGQLVLRFVHRQWRIALQVGISLQV